MTVVMAGILISFGDEPALAFTRLFSAADCKIIFGLLGLGRYITFVPYPVVSGFMSGIGGIILILQVGPLLGKESQNGSRCQSSKHSRSISKRFLPKQPLSDF